MEPRLKYNTSIYSFAVGIAIYVKKNCSLYTLLTATDQKPQKS